MFCTNFESSSLEFFFDLSKKCKQELRNLVNYIILNANNVWKIIYF